MIVLTVLFSVSMPVNAQTILIEIMKLTNLDIIETNWLTDKLINLTYWPAFLLTFEEVGYDTTNFIIELGPLLYIILASALYAIVKSLLTYLLRNSQSKNCLVQRIQKKLNYRGAIIRFFIEGCIELGLIAMICVIRLDYKNWTTWQDSLSTICAFLTLIALFFAPIKLGLVANNLVVTKQEIEAKSINSKAPVDIILTEAESPYAPFFRIYKRKERKQLWYTVLFFYRRFCMILVITILPFNKNTQIISQHVSTVFILC